jgi:hypothetical protein
VDRTEKCESVRFIYDSGSVCVTTVTLWMSWESDDCISDDQTVEDGLITSVNIWKWEDKSVFDVRWFEEVGDSEKADVPWIDSVLVTGLSVETSLLWGSELRIATPNVLSISSGVVLELLQESHCDDGCVMLQLEMSSSEY